MSFTSGASVGYRLDAYVALPWIEEILDLRSLSRFCRDAAPLQDDKKKCGCRIMRKQTLKQRLRIATCSAERQLPGQTGSF